MEVGIKILIVCHHLVLCGECLTEELSGGQLSSEQLSSWKLSSYRSLVPLEYPLNCVKIDPGNPWKIAGKIE